MDYKKLIDLIIESPENISIEYSNIGGVEKLLVNGKDITKFDDSQIKKLVKQYKDTIESLSDCEFVDILENIKKYIDIKVFNDLLCQSVYSEEDAETLESMIVFSNSTIHEYLVNKIKTLQDIIDNLPII